MQFGTEVLSRVAGKLTGYANLGPRRAALGCLATMTNPGATSAGLTAGQTRNAAVIRPATPGVTALTNRHRAGAT